MDLMRGAGERLLIRAKTWFKDSHSLYDYQATRLSVSTYDFSLTLSPLYVFRQRSHNEPVVMVCAQMQLEGDYEQICCFQVRSVGGRVVVCFLPLKVESERMPTQESMVQGVRSCEEPYLIVSRMVSGSEQVGHVMSAGDTIKLGRVQYFVSEVRVNGQLGQGKMIRSSSKSMVHVPKEKKYSCKVCLDDVESRGNFICWPCRCLGECGAIHIQCLKEWIRVKVKSEVVGSTTHYNFQKFICEICLEDLPMEIRGNNHTHQILPIVKPMGNYLMMEGTSEKTNSLLIIEGMSGEGVKLGRSHQCQVRIDDISVSRAHASIRFMENRFVIFDTKSKFGTAVKYPNMQIEISGKNGWGVQIGRTVLEFELRKIKVL